MIFSAFRKNFINLVEIPQKLIFEVGLVGVHLIIPKTVITTRLNRLEKLK